MKKSKKIIALASADFHINNWQEAFLNNTGRLFDSMQPLAIIGRRAEKLNVPILFAGDLFHKPKALDSEVIAAFTLDFPLSVPGYFIAISGNHDQKSRNTLKHKSISYVETFSRAYKNLHCLDFKYHNYGEFGVAGIPYLTHNMGFKKALENQRQKLRRGFNILLIHTDLPGAQTPQGYKVNQAGEIEGDLDKYFEGFDLVLCGHIHKPQILTKKVIMLGSPYQQNRGDMGIEMGYWEIYSDKSYKFVPLDLPKYMYYEGEKPDGKNIYIPKAKMSSKDLLLADYNSFDNSLSRTRIAKNYLKERKIKDIDKRKALITLIKKS